MKPANMKIDGATISAELFRVRKRVRCLMVSLEGLPEDDDLRTLKARLASMAGNLAEAWVDLPPTKKLDAIVRAATGGSNVQGVAGEVQRDD